MPRVDLVLVADAVRSQGYAMWQGFAGSAVMDCLRSEVTAVLSSQRARPYPKSTRAWDLHLCGNAFHDLVCQPQLGQVLDNVLGEGHLLSDLSLNSISPGQPVDDWHIDHPFTEMTAALPTAILGVQCVLAVSPFTADNGATQLLSGTHLPPRRPGAVTGIPTVFEADPGTLLIMAASTWHRSGLNTSAQHRDAILLSFVERWIRPMSAPTVGITHPVPARLASLLGLDRPPEIINGVPV